MSTDDQEIADVSLSCGAEVPFIRPKEFAQDLSPDIDVFRHAIKWLNNQENYQPDLIVHLRPTNPVRHVTIIDKAINKILNHPEADALRSVNVASQTPYKMWRMIDNSTIEPLLSIEGKVDCQSLARQELPQVYWQNGYIDIVRPQSLLDHKSMWGKTVIPFLIEVPDLGLDYPEDVPAVEEALSKINQRAGDEDGIKIVGKVTRHSV